MAEHPEPSLDELLWTARTARELLPADVHLQVPPNLSYDDFPRLLEAGIDDWGGVSPVTIDHVNPEAPWPEIERLRAGTEAHGHDLAARLPIYPEFVADLERWADPRVAREIRRHADADGLAREGLWAAGAPGRMPGLHVGNGHGPSARVTAALARVGDEALDEDDVTALFQARGTDLGAVVAAADDLRREVCGDEVTYVVTRNVNYTNVCYFPLRVLRVLQGQARREPAREAVSRPGRGDRPARPRGLGSRRRRDLPPGRHPPRVHGRDVSGDLRGRQGRPPRPPRARVLGARGLAGSGDARAAARRLSRSPP